MNKKEQIIFFKNKLQEIFPNAKTELYYTNNFQLLIAILMSAQTTDIQVNKVNKEFFKVLKTPKDWLNLWIEKIEKYINSIWFYRNKAKNIYKTCEILNKSDLSNFNTIEKLTTLPWVWVKTAKVFLQIVYDMPFLAVDTHVHRVLNRTWFIKTKTPKETDKKIEKKYSKDIIYWLHHTLVLFWRYKCKARSPECDNCFFKSYCKFYNKKNSKY